MAIFNSYVKLPEGILRWIIAIQPWYDFFMSSLLIDLQYSTIHTYCHSQIFVASQNWLMVLHLSIFHSIVLTFFYENYPYIISICYIYILCVPFIFPQMSANYQKRSHEIYNELSWNHHSFAGNDLFGMAFGSSTTYSAAAQGSPSLL